MGRGLKNLKIPSLLLETKETKTKEATVGADKLVTTQIWKFKNFAKFVCLLCH
jgi:hypothetical protein